MGNSYCKKDYSKGEVDVVEITQIKIQKMKKNVAMASFCCSVSKIWKKIVFYVAIRMQKKRLICVVSSAQKTNMTFFPDIFFLGLITMNEFSQKR